MGFRFHPFGDVACDRESFFFVRAAKRQALSRVLSDHFGGAMDVDSQRAFRRTLWDARWSSAGPVITYPHSYIRRHICTCVFHALEEQGLSVHWC